MTLRYTLWPTLYDLNRPTPIEESWKSFTLRLSCHLRCERKEDAPGFGPYVLVPPPHPCTKHSGSPRSSAHRCDVCVESMSMLVFDVDIGTEADVQKCDSLLAEAGLARHWYSSYSHTPERPAYRLIIPVSKPVAPEHWTDLRRGVLEKFAIPADPQKCSGKSHFYFLPSCPPDGEPVVRTFDGEPLAVEPLIRKPAWTFKPRAVDVDFEPPEEPSYPPTREELQALRAKLAPRLNTWRRDARYKSKVDIVERLLDGRPLADHGARNNSTLVACGVLAYSLPGLALSVYRALLEKSIEEMIAEGSSITWAKVERMLLSSMRNKARADAQDQEISNYLRRQTIEAVRQYIPNWVPPHER